MKKLHTVTILIPAFNEERNISRVLRAVASQQCSDFKLERIIVVSDGSTDATVRKVTEEQISKLEVKAYRERRGKAFRLAQSYRFIRSDVIVQIDADVQIYDKFFLQKLIKPITKQVASLTGANAVPLPGATLVEKAVNVSVAPYARMRRYVPSLSIGPVLAFTKTLVRNLQYPSTVVGEDIYLYFHCLSQKLRYKYVQSAIVYYRSPNNISDHIQQSIRFLTAPYDIRNYYSLELVRKEDSIPMLLYLYETGKVFIRHPFLSTFIFIINKYCLLLAAARKQREQKWGTAISTKS